MTASDSQIDAADFDIGHLLGLDDGVAHVFFGGGGIGNFSLAHAAGARLAETDDIQGSFCAQIADNRADFGGAYFQANDDGGRVKHVSF